MELLEQVTGLLRGALGSPWLWALVFAVAGLDALLPFMPSETTVVTVAVLLGPDPGRLALLTVAAATGAWAGDCLGYAVGRAAGPRALARLQRGPSGRQRYEWASTQVRRQAPLLIIAARYLPGGRVASALANGSLGYPLRRFVPLDALGATLWAVYSALIGLAGGAAFADRPVHGLLLSFALALALVTLIEFGRRLRARRLRSVHGHSASAGGNRRPRGPAEDGGVDGRPARADPQLSEVDNGRPGDTPDRGALLHHRRDHRPPH
ncbi:membrane protein DedA with SNARE-associated domain [Amycolatopsis jiangsuensis]|uniref:Membrane protein DedA with SNARE-associated domain n=1 Tax=Amycolatopsis jiangsuensis TaxID=1181879 RepID=A0A840IZQ2_9PSEU|nr:DedA family protein [Amycolatopsis jiangsuensis]MBB4686638.1 membrane protein DedA with SNARE-associated domain [Amycolatopsis jiangsuensis]